MTAPRMMFPGTTYLVTRRCTGRQFLLRPDSLGLVTLIFEFALALAAWKYGIKVHTYCVMSNHWHAVVTDPGQQLPLFMHDVNMLVGKCMNVYHKRFESLWSSEKYSAVILVNPSDVLDKMVYVMTNPVAAGLVPRWNKWPGAVSGPSTLLEKGRWIERPDLFFRDTSAVPGAVILELEMPPMLEGVMTAQELAKLLDKQVRQKQEKLNAEHRANGHRYLGKAGILAQNPFDCPKGYSPRFGLDPRVACKDKWGRIEMLQRLKEWQATYREAWRAFRENRRALFPEGSYWVVVALGAKVSRTESWLAKIPVEHPA